MTNAKDERAASEDIDIDMAMNGDLLEVKCRSRYSWKDAKQLLRCVTENIAFT
jgi:hypothetical protein